MLQGIVVGLIPGSAYALIAVSIVLTYRMAGVLNFSQAVVGVFGTYVGLALYGAGVPQWFAVAAGVATGALISLMIGLIMMRWFSESSAIIRASVTIALMLALLSVGFRVFGDAPRSVPKLFPNMTLSVAGVNFTTATIVSFVVAVAVGSALSIALHATRLGIRLRAMSERPTTAELLGIPARFLMLLVWGAGGGLTTLAITLVAPNRPSNFLTLSLLLLPAIASALFGLFKSVPAAVTGGLVLGVLEGLSSFVDVIGPYRQALPFVVILLVLLWSQRGEVWDATR
jgi:branched-chain amino acid transport system permease protein